MQSAFLLVDIIQRLTGAADQRAGQWNIVHRFGNGLTLTEPPVYRIPECGGLRGSGQDSSSNNPVRLAIG